MKKLHNTPLGAALWALIWLAIYMFFRDVVPAIGTGNIRWKNLAIDYAMWCGAAAALSYFLIARYLSNLKKQE